MSRRILLAALALGAVAGCANILGFRDIEATEDGGFGSSGDTTGTSSGFASTGTDTGTTSSTGPTAMQTGGFTGTRTTGSATGVSTNTGTGSTTGTGTGTSTSTATTMTYADAAPPPCTTCLQLEYKALSTGDGVTNVGFDVQVTNVASGSQDLTQMTIQYYFNADGDRSALTAEVNSASIITTAAPYYQSITDVTPTFAPFSPPTTSADTVLTIAFTADALPSGGMLEVDIQFHGDGPDGAAFGDMFTQSSDYSYNGADTAFTPSQTITIDVDGATVWGMAP